MKLTMTKRLGNKKSEAKEIRRSGNVPGVIYSPGKTAENIVIDGSEFKTILRQMQTGHLSTTIFTLVDGKSQKKAVVKDIQYHPTSYAVLHLDFVELIEGGLVSVKVPIHCVGEAECAGVKLGGFLRQVIRTILVECDPKNIPTQFIVDVKDLGMRQTKRLRDLAFPAGVKPLAPLDEVVAVVAKR